jgi:Na+/H+-translocating membrane pyrophosphatase
MAITEISYYKYAVFGTRLEILQLNPDNGVYETPLEDNAAAIALEYSYVPEEVFEETDELDVDTQTARAIIYYVRAKFAEDVGNLQLAKAMMDKFHHFARKSRKSKLGTKQNFSIPNGVIRV